MVVAPGAADGSIIARVLPRWAAQLAVRVRAGVPCMRIIRVMVWLVARVHQGKALGARCLPCATFLKFIVTAEPADRTALLSHITHWLW